MSEDNLNLDSLTDDQFSDYIEYGTLPEGMQETVDNNKEDMLEENQNASETLQEENEPEQSSDTNDEDEDNNQMDENEGNEESNEEKNDKQEDDSKEPVEEEPQTINYEEEYKKLFETPIKASGTEVTLQSPDEVISLVQKGIDYTKKMQHLKQYRNYIETIKSENLTKDDFNFLLDLHKGDKKAIKALIDKHSVDTMDLDTNEDAEEYKPNSHVVSEDYVQMAEVIESIKHSPYKEQIGSLLGGGWDSTSITRVSNDPQLMTALLQEFQMGRFETIQKKVIKDRLLSDDNVSDLDRYIAYAQADEKAKSEKQPNSKPDVESKQNTPSNNNKDGARITKNKKSSPPKKELTDEEINKMSDEDFDAWMMRDLNL